MSDSQDSRLIRRGLLLEYLTLGWNVVGSVVVFAAAWRARSVALAGFGLDSLVEIVASVVVVWQLKGTGRGREKLALRAIGVAFFLLAAYVLVQAFYVIMFADKSEPSSLGIIWLTLTVVTMLLLALGKSRTGRALGNEVLKAEARVALGDAYLAASVLAGLTLNAAFGWWWADPVASLVIVGYGLKEGRHAWKEAA